MVNKIDILNFATKGLIREADATGTNTGDQDLSGLANVLLSNVSSTGKTLISDLSKPSNTFVSLTLPATNGTIQAPYDGYMVINKLSTATGQHVGIGYRDIAYTTQVRYSTSSVQYLSVILPCAKDQYFYLDYDANGTTNVFGCIRAKGTI